MSTRGRTRCHCLAGKLAKGGLGPVRTAVHEHAVVDDYQKIVFASSAQFEHAVRRVNCLYGLPRLGHEEPLLPRIYAMLKRTR